MCNNKSNKNDSTNSSSINTSCSQCDRSGLVDCSRYKFNSRNIEFINKCGRIARSGGIKMEEEKIEEVTDLVEENARGEGNE